MNEELRSDYFGYSVECSTCHHTKKPIGRSAPMGPCYCDEDCDGYYKTPLASNLWPNESEADFGYKVSR